MRISIVMRIQTVVKPMPDHYVEGGAVTTGRISTIDGIVVHIHVQVRLATPEKNRSLADPPSHHRIIIPCAKVHEPRIRVVQATRKTDR